jgi:hypothetical protein
MYLYSDMHELFFVEFTCLLYEWLKRQIATNKLNLLLSTLILLVRPKESSRKVLGEYY